MRELIDGYFKLRKGSDGLKRVGARFEGLFWQPAGNEVIRKSDGWELHVYSCEGHIEACVISPYGETTTYS
jgi:hypothetical protein